MSTTKTIDSVLALIAQNLDIPAPLYEKAVRRYEALGKWLAEQDALKARRAPEVYPQGSFRLGTMIRPVVGDDEYDIDLVYMRDLAKASTTHARLKAEAGEHLQSHVEVLATTGETAPDLEEGKRCWTLDYEDEFHMDVLPAIPDAEGGETAILLTDRDLTEWQNSDPKGYADWFLSVMREEFSEERILMAEQAGVDDVPRWRVRTLLQRAVQIMKRHRDIRFKDDPDNKPTSIILTTCAARAYRRSTSLYEGLVSMVPRMRECIEQREGVYWVENPVNPEENFADRWEEHPDRATRFFKWLDLLEQDLSGLRGLTTRDAVVEDLGRSLGSGVVTEATAGTDDGEEIFALAYEARRGMVSAPGLATATHAQGPQWPVRQQGKVRVRGAVYRGVRTTQKLWDMNSARSLPKNVGLKFQANTNVTGDFQVYWQVVNTGNEAARIDGGLRGGFEDGSGPNGWVRWESTSYSGTHWVEAFVVKNGVCVARSGRYYVRVR